MFGRPVTPMPDLQHNIDYRTRLTSAGRKTVERVLRVRSVFYRLQWLRTSSSLRAPDAYFLRFHSCFAELRRYTPQGRTETFRRPQRLRMAHAWIGTAFIRFDAGGSAVKTACRHRSVAFAGQPSSGTALSATPKAARCRPWPARRCLAALLRGQTVQRDVCGFKRCMPQLAGAAWAFLSVELRRLPVRCALSCRLPRLQVQHLYAGVPDVLVQFLGCTS